MTSRHGVREPRGAYRSLSVSGLAYSGATVGAATSAVP